MDPGSYAKKIFPRRHTAPIAMLALLLLCATGCMTGFREYFANGFKVGPNYRRPVAPVADNWIDYQDPRVISEPAVDWAWWRVFNDPVLDSLVLTAYRQNLTLREAGFRMLAARANLQGAVGNFFPQTQELNGGYTRQQISEELGFGGQFAGSGGIPGGGGFGFGQNFSIWNFGPALAWELDFWGRFRRGIEQGDAELDAAVENYDSVLVFQLGNVALAYIQIRTFEQRLAYARANAAHQRGSLEIAQQKFEQGATSRLDVAQALSNLAQTESKIPVLEAQLRRAQNALCVLLGIPPQSIESLLAGSRGIPDAPAEAVVGIPADLLRRRPEVRSYERRAAAFSAKIGIAEADLYPSFFIGGSLTLQAADFADLFNSTAVAGSVGPRFSWKILNYGRIRANVALKTAEFQLAVTEYQRKVLEANRDAEDAMIDFLRTQQQAQALRQSVTAAEESRDIVDLLYRGGRADFGRVFVAEAFLVTQQDLYAEAEGKIAENLVRLYVVLGGGWQLRLSGPPPAAAVTQPVPTEAVPPPPPAPSTENPAAAQEAVRFPNNVLRN